MITSTQIASKPWMKDTPPKRVLAIRLQAMGDMIITLPYLQALKNTLPAGTKLDFLTLEEVAAIPKSLTLFNNVYSIKGGRSFKKQFIYTCFLLPKLMLNRYEVVIDLQNNLLSRLVRKCIMPNAWSEFDRFSPVAAGERTRMTIESAGLGGSYIDSHFIFKQAPVIDKLLMEKGWDGQSRLVILNPAGAFATRNWSTDNYIAFAKLWLVAFPATQFVVIGVSFIAGKGQHLKQALGNKLINLVDKTSPVEAFAIVQKVWFILSEDSGLMHIAWVSGVPTIALFGSTRSDWSRPLGKHSLLLSSDDLPCGNCLLEVCKYSDVHCLTRYTPEIIFEKVTAFLQSINL